LITSGEKYVIIENSQKCIFVENAMRIFKKGTSKATIQAIWTIWKL